MTSRYWSETVDSRHAIATRDAAFIGDVPPSAGSPEDDTGARYRVRNSILSRLDPRELEILSHHLRRVTLVSHQVLRERCIPDDEMFFIEEGVVKLTAVIDGGELDVGLVDREGLLGARAIFSTDASPVTEAQVQISGSALRARTDVITDLLGQLPTLDQYMRAYVMSQYDELQIVCACNVLHNVMQRFARYILHLSDSADMIDIPLTQEAVALALGVRRLSIHTAAQTLRELGGLRWGRGHILITDRSVLEHTACECYRRIKEIGRRKCS